MGGDQRRAAGAVATEVETPWTSLVSDVVTLGTPHLGAPIDRSVHAGARALGGSRVRAFAEILDGLHRRHSTCVAVSPTTSTPATRAATGWSRPPSPAPRRSRRSALGDLLVNGSSPHWSPATHGATSLPDADCCTRQERPLRAAQPPGGACRAMALRFSDLDTPDRQICCPRTARHIGWKWPAVRG